MGFRIRSLRFNHDPSQSVTSALNLRKNRLAFSDEPEWIRGRSFSSIDCRAAYAIGEVDLDQLAVMAVIERDPSDPLGIEIRAVNPVASLQGPVNQLLQLLPHPDLLNSLWNRYDWWQAFVQSLAHFNYSTYYQSLRALLSNYRNVLGEIGATTVTFQPGQTRALVSLHPVGTELKQRGVGIHDDQWLWQFRFHGLDYWKAMDLTRQRIYTTLAEPVAPWSQQPFDAGNLNLPWADLLEFSCRWAFRAETADEASGAITDAVYGLGGVLFEYGCEVGTVSMYSDFVYDLFDCSAFLERLKGGPGNGPYVNCSDCASMVTSMANILGAGLWQSTMGIPSGGFFMTNPVMAIGSTRWQSPCGWGQGFTYHEVAWKGECDVEDGLFDACLALDADISPEQFPHDPILARGMRFGRPGERQYVDLFIAPEDRTQCLPAPSNRRRRAII